VECQVPDDGAGYDPPSDLTTRIGANVADFLAAELTAGRLPASFLPVQSGVGDVANAVLGALGRHPDIPVFEMYTEILQEAVIRLMQAGRVRFASCCGLALTPALQRELYADLESYRGRVLLRPQEITNHPEVVRRLGLISMNTALEADIFGNVHSTHLLGRDMMNGIGGSGDFTRNAWLVSPSNLNTRSASATCSEPVPQDGVRNACSAMTCLAMPAFRDKLSDNFSKRSINLGTDSSRMAALVGISPQASAFLFSTRCFLMWSGYKAIVSPNW
jgi:acyl-CoA hydrolase